MRLSKRAKIVLRVCVGLALAFIYIPLLVIVVVIGYLGVARKLGAFEHV